MCSAPPSRWEEKEHSPWQTQVGMLVPTMTLWLRGTSFTCSQRVTSKWAHVCLPQIAASRGLNIVRLFQHLACCPTQRKCPLNVYWRYFIIIRMDDHAHHRCCILSQKSPKPMHCLAPSSQRNYPFHGNSWLGTDTMMLPLGLSGQGLGVPMFFPTGYKSIS